MENKVYVVTRGRYSDYGISAIFTDKKLAQSFIESFKQDGYPDFNDIEEYVLDPHKNELSAGRKAYSLQMDIDGKVSNIEQSDSTFGFDGSADLFTYDSKWMNIYCYAKDEAHAIKIANEKRVQIKAMNMWGSNFNNIE